MRSPNPRYPNASCLLTRVFDAPVELVWQAWTQKPHLEKWLAPHTVTIVHAQVDLRPGGRWRLRVRFPGGAEYWVGGVYREIVPNKLLVMTDTWDEEFGDARPGDHRDGAVQGPRRQDPGDAASGAVRLGRDA